MQCIISSILCKNYWPKLLPAFSSRKSAKNLKTQGKLQNGGETLAKYDTLLVRINSKNTSREFDEISI
jgi:hypothetical protein